MPVAKHSFALLAAALAIVASFLQGKKAIDKSEKHGTLKNQMRRNGQMSETESTFREVLASDVDHFKAVGRMWYVITAGAVATLCAEIFDLF